MPSEHPAAARLPHRGLRRRRARTRARWRSARRASSSSARATAGKVYAVVDRDGDGARRRGARCWRSGLDKPNGVAFRDGALYVAEVDRILRFDDIEARPRRARPRPVVVTDGYPTRRAPRLEVHRASGPTAGSTCRSARRATSASRPDPLRLDHAHRRPTAAASRSSRAASATRVGFDWHPETRELWFTDNGRDRLGDDLPPDELNRAPRAGHALRLPVLPRRRRRAIPSSARARAASEFTPPARKLGPHVAALGMRFYTGTMFPAEYRGQIFIAEHGSWNRSHADRLPRDARARRRRARRVLRAVRRGWLQGERRLGRPVDVLVVPDGALLVSDDQAGAIYRISY